MAVYQIRTTRASWSRLFLKSTRFHGPQPCRTIHIPQSRNDAEAHILAAGDRPERQGPLVDLLDPFPHSRKHSRAQPTALKIWIQIRKHHGCRALLDQLVNGGLRGLESRMHFGCFRVRPHGDVGDRGAEAKRSETQFWTENLLDASLRIRGAKQRS
ncbi:hypothetical protein BKA81DRAFT_362811 [Phyllosticta paracitricarpa]